MKSSKLSSFKIESKISHHVEIKILLQLLMVMFIFGLVLKMDERFQFLSKFSSTLQRFEFQVYLVEINMLFW